MGATITPKKLPEFFYMLPLVSCQYLNRA
jgi:hypothetical protein